MIKNSDAFTLICQPQSGSNNEYPSDEKSYSKNINSFLADPAKIKMLLGSFEIDFYQSSSGELSDGYSFDHMSNSPENGLPLQILMNIDPEQKFNEATMQNLAFAIHQNDEQSAFKQLVNLIESGGTEFLFSSLRNEYRFLIDLAVGRNMLDVAFKLTEFKPVLEYLIEKDTLGKVNSYDEKMSPYANEFVNVLMDQSRIKGLEKESILALIFAFPLFMNEELVIQELYNAGIGDKKFVVDFLELFVEAGVSSYKGLESLIVNLLRDLQMKFQIEDHLIDRIFIKVFPKKKDVPLAGSSLIKWQSLNEEDIATALTKRDAYLVQAIQPIDIKLFLATKVAPKSIRKLESTFQKTIHWISFQMTKELDENKRSAIIEKFINIGNILLKNKNLHGAAQVALALEISAVDRFLTPLQKNNSNYQNIFKLSKFKVHAEYMDAFHIHDSTEILLPISCVFWTDLQLIYGKMIGSVKNRIDENSIKEIAKYGCLYANFGKTGPLQCTNDAYHFVSNL
ncbi:MAG TPA: RasGEF domain-containing protein [Parachlamydiaceae bacterium]|nr:RasGEF domain-containing protein [Parachlamydiaceae bacterium]